MPPSIRRSIFSLVVLSLLLANSLPARADSVKLTGTGVLGNDLDGTTFSAGLFSGVSFLPGGPSQVGSGLVGVPMTLSWYSGTWYGSCCTLANVGSQTTDLLTGQVLFTASFTIPASALLTGSFTTPVTVSGELQAFQDLTYGQGFVTQGPLMATLLFTGTGTATFQLNDLGQGFFVIQQANASFNGQGTLTVAPEPTSLLLMGTGLAALAGIVRRKLSFF